MSKKDSIYVQLLRLLLISAFTAIITFLVLDYALEYIINSYYSDSDYEKQQDISYIRRLQNYIVKRKLSSKDVNSLNNWVREQKIISICIYKDNIPIFDSEYPELELWKEGNHISDIYWGESYYNVEFSDGKAQVLIRGLYTYQTYYYAMVAELVCSFGLFLMLVLFGIRRKINYIRKLSDEVEILEGGSLDYNITVKGRDELATLALGLDSMRISFQNLIEQEAKLVQENQKIITEMSHDVRTPVTSIMLYTEILKKGRYKDGEQLKEYIDKIDKKIHRMKQLTDHLFEYSLVTGGEKIVLEEPESFDDLFYDLLSETCSYLQQKGFGVDFKVEWVNEKIQVYTDYIIRIMDNITSNIIKYADSDIPLVISSVNSEKMVGLSFSNAVRQKEERVESTQVGIQSIKSMMMKMGGVCEIEQDENNFCIQIAFPVH